MSSVPLPKRAIVGGKSDTPAVWKTFDSEKASEEECLKEEGSEREVCCKQLKGADDRTLIDPDVLRDLVIGFADGITVPFALTAGLSSLGSTHFVVVAGLAELISGAISMGIGSFLAAQADRNQYLYYMRTTEERVKRSCMGEMEREVHEVLEASGVDKKVASLVALSLYRADKEAGDQTTIKLPFYSLRSLTARIGGRVGLTPFLVHFGEGMEETTKLRMLISGVTVGTGYLIGGIIPLMPYLIIKDNVLLALYWSIGVTCIVLLTFGSLNAYFTGAGKGAGGVIYGAFSTLAIGAAAAACSYGVVKALEV